MGIGKYIVALALFGYMLSALKVFGDLAALLWLVYLPPLVLIAGMAIIVAEVILGREKHRWIALPVIFFGIGIAAHLVSVKYHEEGVAGFRSSLARAEKIDWPETTQALGIERDIQSPYFQPAELLANYDVPVIVERQTDTNSIFRYEAVARTRRQDGATQFTDRDGVTYFPMRGERRASIAMRMLEEWPQTIDTIITERAMESNPVIGWKATYDLRHADRAVTLVAGNSRILGWVPAVAIRRDPMSRAGRTDVEYLFSRRSFFDARYIRSHERVAAILGLPPQDPSRFEGEESQGDGSVAAR